MTHASASPAPTRRCRPRSGPPDGPPEHPEAHAAGQDHGQGAGVPHRGVPLPPDALPHPAGHLHAPDGRHDGGRWSHSARGESPDHFHSVLISLVRLSSRV